MKNNFLNLVLGLGFMGMSVISCSDTTKPLYDSIYNANNSAPLVILQDLNNFETGDAGWDDGILLVSERADSQVRVNYKSDTVGLLKHEVYVSPINWPAAVDAEKLTDVPATAKKIREITTFPSGEVIITKQEVATALGVDVSTLTTGRTIYFFGKSTGSKGLPTFNQWFLETWTRREGAHAYLYRWVIK